MSQLLDRVILFEKLRRAMQKNVIDMVPAITRNSDGVNPYYSQVDLESNLIICEFYYNSPSKLYSPIGEVRLFDFCYSSGSTKDVLENFKNEFGLVEVRPGYTSALGYHGPWYAVTKTPWGDTFEAKDFKLSSTPIDYETANKIYDTALEKISQEERNE